MCAGVQTLVKLNGIIFSRFETGVYVTARGQNRCLLALTSWADACRGPGTAGNVPKGSINLTGFSVQILRPRRQDLRFYLIVRF